MIIDVNLLKTEIETAKTKGELTEKLARMCMQIARTRIKCDVFRSFSDSDCDEILSEFAARLTRYWDKLNPEKNPFSYITSMLDFAKRDWLRCQDRYKKIIECHDISENFHSASEMQIQKFIVDSKTARKTNNYNTMKRITLSEIMTIEKMAKKIDNDLGDIIGVLTSEIRAMRKLLQEVSGSRIGKDLKEKVMEVVK